MSMDVSPVTALTATAPTAPVQRDFQPALPGKTTAQPAQDKDDKREAKADEVNKAVKDIQDFVSTVTTDLRFTVDKETGRTIVSVVDSKTQQVVRQIPSEEIMKIARNIDRMQGLLFHDKA